MGYAQHFSDAALALLRDAQGANMPDRALIFTRSIQRAAGGVATAVYSLDRVERCRLSRSRAIEQPSGTTKSEHRTWVVARPHDAERLDGTEQIVVVCGDGRARVRFSLTVRPIGAAQPQSFDSVQLADVTSDGIAQRAIALSNIVSEWTTSAIITLGP